MFNFFFAPSPPSPHNPGPLSQVLTDFAKSTRTMLQRASIWLQTLSFSPPRHQQTIVHPPPSTHYTLPKLVLTMFLLLQPTCTCVLVLYVFFFFAFCLLYVVTGATHTLHLWLHCNHLHILAQCMQSWPYMYVLFHFFDFVYDLLLQVLWQWMTMATATTSAASETMVPTTTTATASPAIFTTTKPWRQTFVITQ